MKDMNGVEIKVGDVVAVTDSYFKCDNCLYFVDKVEGMPGWLGGVSLVKISKKGKISTAKYNLNFWPLTITCNDIFKKIEARAYNEAHAKIAVVNNVDKSEIVEHFKNELANAISTKKNYETRFESTHEIITMIADMIKYYQKTIERLS